jgi:hypothetical protein
MGLFSTFFVGPVCSVSTSGLEGRFQAPRSSAARARLRRSQLHHAQSFIGASHRGCILTWIAMAALFRPTVPF